MLKWALGAIIILILLSGVALSILLDQPERFRPQIEALAAEQVGAPVRLGQLSWQWQPNFALSVSEVEINPNDGPIVQVQLVDVDFKASLLALLTEQSLVVLGIEVERMSVLQREASSASSTPEARAQSQPRDSRDTANEAWQASLRELPALLLTTFEQVEVNQLEVSTLTLETEGRSEPDVILSPIRLTMQNNQLTAVGRPRQNSSAQRASHHGADEYQSTCLSRMMPYLRLVSLATSRARRHSLIPRSFPYLLASALLGHRLTICFALMRSPA